MKIFDGRFAISTMSTNGSDNFVQNLVRAAVEVGTGMACFFTSFKMESKLIRRDPEGNARAVMDILTVHATARLYGTDKIRDIEIPYVDSFTIENAVRRGWNFQNRHARLLHINIGGECYYLNISNSVVRPDLRVTSDRIHDRGLGGEYVGTHVGDRRYEKYTTPAVEELSIL